MQKEFAKQSVSSTDCIPQSVFMKCSNASDCMPDTPSEPISSLSAKMHTAVFSGMSSCRIAASSAYAQTRSSWPYAPMRLRSKPRSRALAAGTASSSAEIKSSSTMPYFSCRMRMMASFTRSGPSSSGSGQLPMRMLRDSDGMASFSGFLPCSRPRWGRRSLMTNCGSSGSAPILT